MTRKGFPADPTVKRFRVARSPTRTDLGVTNDVPHDTTSATQQPSGGRWKIAPFHRDAKPLTALAGCQGRKARRVRNPITSARLVGVRLKQVAQATQRSLYPAKHGLLSDYLRQQLRSPSIAMVLA